MTLICFIKKTTAENFNDFLVKLDLNLHLKYLIHLLVLKKIWHGDYPSLQEKPAIKTLKILKTKKRFEYEFFCYKRYLTICVWTNEVYFNLSIESSIFPDKLKIAKVFPLFKKGHNGLMDSDHPISVLRCFWQILEKIIYNRLYSFFTENNILYEKQFVFQN